MSFERRQFALEGAFVRDLDRTALARHAEKLGLLSEGGLAPVSHSELPTTRVVSRPAAEQVFQYTRGPQSVYTPHLLSSPANQLGTKVSFGRARWDVDGTSIFSVRQGTQLAQEPVKQLSHFETQRMKRVRAAQWESPAVKGLRLLPVFTPGRALLWGTIFAVWGSSACVLTGMKALGIEKGDNIGEKMKEILTPYGVAAANMLDPVRSAYAASDPQQLERPSALAHLTTTLKRTLSSSQ